MNSKRNTISFALFVCIFNVLLMIGCRQALEETADIWLTYRNEVHHYAFSYPADCTFGPMPDYCKEYPPEKRPKECLCVLNAENPDDVRLEKLIIADDKISIAAFSITQYETSLYHPPPDTNLVAWLEENLPRSLAEHCPDEVNAEIGGVPAVAIFTPKSPMAFASTSIFFICNDDLLLVHMNDVDDIDNMRIYSRILRSFRFENGNM